MKKNPQLPIPMMNSNQSMRDFINENLITCIELSRMLEYNVAENTISNWLRGNHTPDNFEKVCRKNKDKLIEYSQNKIHQIFDSNQTKPQNFYNAKYVQRYALKWLCNQENWEFPYALYQLNKKILLKRNLGELVVRYNNSISNTVAMILSEFEWHMWKFYQTPPGWFQNNENKMTYLKWFENKMKIRKPDDWYKVRISDLKENYGNAFLSSYFNNDVKKVANFLYPNFDFHPWKFYAPKNIYNDFDILRNMIEQKANELGFRYPEDYYKFSLKEHFPSGGISKAFLGGITKLFRIIYPDYKWYEWLFDGGVPNNFWASDKNIIRYTLWLENQLKMKSLDEWYDINNDIIKHYNGAGLLVHSGKNLSELVSLAYPSHHWDVTKFGQKKFTSQKRLFKVLTQIYPNEEILYNIRHHKIKNPKTNHPLELDCFIPSLNIAFEYQGKQHKEKSRFFHSKKSRDSYEDLIYRDKIKKKRCKELGIKLIEIFEGHWDFTRNDLMRIINES